MSHSVKENERAKYKIPVPVPGFVEPDDAVDATRASEILRRSEWQDKEADDDDDYGETRGTAELERTVLSEEEGIAEDLLQPTEVPQLVPSSVEETKLSQVNGMS